MPEGTSPPRGFYTYSIRGCILNLKAEGNYSTEVVEKVVGGAMSDPALPPRTWVLADLRGSRDKPTQEELAARIAIFERFRSRIQGAAFVVADQARFEIFRAYQARAAVSNGPVIEVFWSLGEAEAWVRGRAMRT